ncbi:MAG: hypothetical protein Q6363_002265 [Candidatus Njordarchaeota archaeon]
MGAVTGLTSFFIDKIIEYLKLMKKDFEVKPEGIKVKEKSEDGEEFEVVILPTEKWVRIMTKLDVLDEIPEEHRNKLLEELMKANSDYPEISFGIDEEGIIVSVEDQYVYALYFDVFEEEYTAVVASVDIYKKIKESLLAKKKKQVEAV